MAVISNQSVVHSGGISRCNPAPEVYLLPIQDSLNCQLADSTVLYEPPSTMRITISLLPFLLEFIIVLPYLFPVKCFSVHKHKQYDG